MKAFHGAATFLLGCLVGLAACGSDDSSGLPVQESDAGSSNEAHDSGPTSERTAPGTESGSAETGGDASDATSNEAATAASCHIPATEADQPMLLSQTGCVDPKDPTKPNPALIPYDVNSPLWSDGAKKQRFIAIPAGKKIHVKDCAVDTAACAMGTATPEDEGHWDLPVGTVLMKTFSVGGKLIETRLLMRMTEKDWLGFSYEWNDQQTEATLLDNALDKNLASTPPQTWHFPGRAQCLQCHTKEAGYSLGPSTQQFNRDFAYSTGTKNQIAAFSERNLFDSAPKMLAPYPTPTTTASGDLNQRARSYLHANCAICHRPGGELADIDLRFTTAFKDTRLCNQNISKSQTELPPKRLVPGMPAQSTLSYRMHDGSVGFCYPNAPTCTDDRMPKIGSYLVDSDGTKLIDDWIKSVPADCMMP